MKTSFTGYWTFFCSPHKWEIDRFLASGIEYDDYQVTSWQEQEFQTGQLGVVRVGIDKRTKTELAGREKLLPGIYGLVEILSTVHQRGEDLDEFWINGEESAKGRSIVKIRYLKNLLHEPLLLKELKTDSDITDEYLINGFQASSMPLNKKTFARIVKLIDGDSVFDNIKPEPVNTPDEVRKLEDKYACAVPEVKEVISKRIERGPIGNKVKKMAGYKCMICESLGMNPISFYKKDGVPYVEAHHVTSVSKLEAGSLSHSNVISVCANHHRQIHFGNTTVITNTDDILILKIDDIEIKLNKIKF